MNIKTKYAAIKKDLQHAGIESPALDARILLCDVCDLSHENFVLQSDRELNPAEEKILDEFVTLRLRGKPVAKIIGQKEFYGRLFITTEDTLDPRPESEILIETVLDPRWRKDYDREGLRILDLGTGTGCLILTLLAELENAIGVAVDRSEPALNIAMENAKKLHLSERVQFIQGDWFDHVTGKFDIIVSNPPYIPGADIPHLARDVRLYDPMYALDGGADGLDCYRLIIPQLPDYLYPGGLVVFEGGQGQDVPIARWLKETGFKQTFVKPDLAGINRIVAGIGLQNLPNSL